MVQKYTKFTKEREKHVINGRFCMKKLKKSPKMYRKWHG
jgi:hypothetical protein